MLHKCFKQGCELDVQYVCQCLSSDTYCCEFHLETHLKLPNRTHSFDSVLVKPPEGTKDVILGFLAKEMSRIKKLKKIVSTSFKPNLYNSRNNVEETLNKLDSDLEKIIVLVEKISQNSKQEQDQHYSLWADTDGVGNQVSKFSEAFNSEKLLRLCELRMEKCPILKGPNNAQVEKEFRRTCLQYNYQSQASKLSMSQAFQDYADSYHHITSLYLIGEKDKRVNLYIYNTEKETEQAKALEIPEELNIMHAFIVQLASGGLFCMSYNGEACIIDRNYEVRVFSFEVKFWLETAITFKESVYCFGADMDDTPQSFRFDLNKNHLFKLAPMPADDILCNSVIFNEKILISRTLDQNLLLYSIDIDSFTSVPYDFAKQSQKILIIEAERVYLIECPGFIYQSQAWDIYNWTQITKSIINHEINEVYCSYNKGGIYISANNGLIREYYKFDLNRKVLTEVAYYAEHIAIRRINKKLEAINCYSKIFKLRSDHAEGYIQKGYTLWDLGKKLGDIQNYNEAITQNPSDYSSYFHKAETLAELGRKKEAIECYNKGIKLNPSDSNSYCNKGVLLAELGRKKEAIECYSEAIRLDPSDPYFHYNKGVALMDLGEKKEAMECFNKAIEIDPNDFIFFCYRACILNDLGQETEALENFIRACDLMQDRKISEEHSSEESYESYSEEKDQNLIELLWKLSEFQGSAINFKEELQKLKIAFSENFGLLKKIEEKEAIVKEQHSQLLKRAAKCLESSESNQTELRDQIEEEVMELKKTVATTISQLRSEAFN